MVIDDDKPHRHDPVIDYWSKLNRREKFSYEWSLVFPSDFVNHLMFHPEINCISFDNDLGGQDVSKELHTLSWTDTDALYLALKDKRIIIHSMNNTAATNIYHTLLPFTNDITLIPFSMMLSPPERSEDW